MGSTRSLKLSVDPVLFSSPDINIVFFEWQVWKLRQFQNDLPEVYVKQPTQLKVTQKHQAWLK